MKLIGYRIGSRVRAGLIEGDLVYDFGPEAWLDQPDGSVFGRDEIDVLAPVPRPGKLVAVGLNYVDHAAEAGQELPSVPLLFAKFPNSVIGPEASIRIPPVTSQVDYEAELGVVIGKQARGVALDDALEHVLGYTCLNDVSARDLQFADGQWVRGKSLDTFCPMGPHLITADEVPDPQVLPIRCEVNGQVLQDGSTKDMIFSVAELIAFVSATITLEPGDVIATGTPPGVGFSRTPPVFLTPGDRVTVTIDGVGSLSNPVAAA